jgi:hypothetical protein
MSAYLRSGRMTCATATGPKCPQRDAKIVPDNIEQHVLAETRLTAYRVKNRRVASAAGLSSAEHSHRLTVDHLWPVIL